VYDAHCILETVLAIPIVSRATVVLHLKQCKNSHVVICWSKNCCWFQPAMGI